MADRPMSQASYEVLSAMTRAVAAARQEIITEVGSRLHWNVIAYGTAWTGEDEDTSFIVGDAARKALDAALADFASAAGRPLAVTDTAVAAASEVIIAEVGERLRFNQVSYGRAWCGEDADTAYLVGDAARKALDAAAPHLAQ